jgi:hypothetical protein
MPAPDRRPANWPPAGVAVAQAEDTYLVRPTQDGYPDAYGELAGRHIKLAYRVTLN